MKVLIIDDETPATLVLAEKLGKYDYIDLCGTACSGDIGLKLIKEVQPEILFLDVELPDMSGIDFLKKMREISTKPCHVIMYTAHSDYMLSSFRNNAFDYLMKPIDEKELDTVLSRITTEKKSAGTPDVITHNDANDKNSNEEKLLFYTNTVDFRLVHLRDIGLFQYNHEQRVWEAVVACRKEPIKLKRNANNETLLAIDNRFVQVSQKYIVNINYLLEVNDNICSLYPPFDKIDYIKVGRLYRKKLIERFNSL